MDTAGYDSSPGRIRKRSPAPPVRWSFDPASRRFELVYETRGVRGRRFASGVETKIVTPRLQYPSGYHVQVRGARVVSRPNARLLVVAARPGARRVEVTVRTQPRR